MPRYVLTLLAVGPPAEVADAAERHRARLRKLSDEGKLILAGAFSGGDGFLEIYEPADRLEADAIARGSPLVEDGLVSWMIREWEPLQLS